MASHAINFPVQKEPLLRNTLEEAGFSFRSLQYGYWQAVGKGMTVSLYTSGRLVLQGDELSLQTFLNEVEKFLEGVFSQIGCDECGKGDVFGPLVMVAVGVPKENIVKLQMLGISESKKASLNQLRQWYGEIRCLCQVEELVWSPEAYNELYEHYHNLNTILTLGYEDLLRRFEGTWDEVVVDAYTQETHVYHLLSQISPGKLILETHAERYPAVGAASLIARKLFLDWFDSQEQVFPKGCGQEAKEIFLKMKESDPRGLRRYAKVHFFGGK
ncbi:MAG: ribonuclease HIII [Brevinematales bacterium]|nr:ribonuclease HIII [Brevinematales bacterium]